MGDSDIRNSEYDDDPFETYLGTTTDETEDSPVARRWSWPRGVFTRPVWALAAVVLATASLLGISASQFVGEFLSINSGGYTGQVASPAIDAGFAAAAIVMAVLALRHDEDDETAWHRVVAAAAIVLAVLSVLVNLAAVGAVLQSSDPNQSAGFVASSG